MKRPAYKRLLQALRPLPGAMRGVADALEILDETVQELGQLIERVEAREHERHAAMTKLAQDLLARLEPQNNPGDEGGESHGH